MLAGLMSSSAVGMAVPSGRAGDAGRPGRVSCVRVTRSVAGLIAQDDQTGDLVGLQGKVEGEDERVGQAGLVVFAVDLGRDNVVAVVGLGIADQRSQARRGRREGRRHHHPKRRNGAGLGPRRRRGAQRPGPGHGTRDRRDARAGSRLRRDPAHRCPAGRRVRGRGIDPPGRAGGAMNIKVLIADDQALIRSGLRAIIESEPGMEVAGEVGDGAEAVEAVRRLRPHVALMDIRMPRLDGVAATRALLRGAAPVPARILILTTFHLDAYVTEALRAGASGCLLKEATADQLIEAVRVIASGEAILAPSVTRRLLETMAEDPAAAGDGGQQIRDLLSAREADVLLLVRSQLTWPILRNVANRVASLI